MGTVKVAILEKDGVEYELPVEMDLLEAISFAGYSPEKNFSIKKVTTDKIITIPSDQQMIVVDGIEINGSLDIEGELCLIS